ncbi:MAG: acyl-CoA carboxylase subunit beta [Candidatus Loosdrechtia sp.]|uniref:acyl-CoA carboxylase subunit beta n=1 Tax=Candidatus Loosdrechtia sp. TaxID=3101272 RepID=UPI003A608E9B|nr:MAG: acyl-CoA carboxylase subunit beta [Candidatus Jettenia sp. AMX2]
MTISQKLIEEYEERRNKILTGLDDKIRERHEKGLMTARERITNLFDENTFQEMGMHARHACREFGMEKKFLPGDGVVTGTGYIDGKPAVAFSQDFMVGGGALGAIHARKICNIMDYAIKTGIPVIGFNDSGGARIQEGVDSLSGYGQVFYKNVMLSGVVPQIAVIAGHCAGGAAYSPALMDFIIMIQKNAHMFICGPDVIKAATGQAATMDEIGGAATHAAVSGNIHFIAEDERHAIGIIRQLLSYLPPNNVLDPPHQTTTTIPMVEDHEMNDLIPSGNKEPYDVLEIVRRLVDKGIFLEIQKDWAKNIVIGLARIEGVVTGIVANQSMVKAGTIDIDASDKASRFVRFCNAFNIPLLTLADVPGFLPGIAQEHGGIIRHGAKMLFAYAEATVPKITVILRKAYGGAYLAMCSSDMGADAVFAWPTAEIAVMGAEGAVKILYRREIEAAQNPKAKEAEFVSEYQKQFASPYPAAAHAYITDVIMPSRTRSMVALALRTALSKRETRPPKKHGNIPL